MRYLASQEHAVRGTFDFPIERYEVDRLHPRYEMPFHWHMEHELIHVREGSLHLSIDGEGYDLHPGDSMLVAGGSIHGGTPKDCRYECAVFDLERFLTGAKICGAQLSALLADGARLEAFFPCGSPAAAITGALFSSMAEKFAGYELTITGLLWQLLGEMLRGSLYRPASAEHFSDRRRTHAVKKVLRRIREDYSEPLTLERLAAEAALDPKYLCRVFRQVTGRTPIDYLNYYRIECAAELLCSTKERVTDISLACGFGDVSYFSRVFRRFKQQTPAEYRKTHG